MVRLTILFYGPALVSLFFLRAPGVLRVADWLRLGWTVALALALGMVVVALSRAATRHSAWGAALHGEFRQVLGRLDAREILVLSLLSAFCEEIFFRGVLHPRLGLWVTAALFGAVHFPIRRRLIPWTGFALVLGLGLGVLTNLAGSLWPSIVLHFVINHFNLHDLTEPLPGAVKTPPEQRADAE